jgi:hypothetical protein
MSGSAVTIANNHQTTPLRIREIDAARALLGVAPHSYSEGGPSELDATGESSVPLTSPENVNQRVDPSQLSSENDDIVSEYDVNYRYSKDQVKRSGSNGLETLAELAEREQNASTNRPIPSFLLPTGLDNLPEPRRLGRLRSISNPEGMEKWDSIYSRRHFFLPASILEEELAEANEAVRQRSISPEKDCYIHEMASPFEMESELPSQRVNNEHDDNAALSCFTETENREDPDELLRQARFRILEDISSETWKLDNCDKNELTLPHSLSKYKEVSSMSILLLLSCC